MKWQPLGIDMPVVYLVIASSTIIWGLACAVFYWKGW